MFPSFPPLGTPSEALDALDLALSEGVVTKLSAETKRTHETLLEDRQQKMKAKYEVQPFHLVPPLRKIAHPILEAFEIKYFGREGPVEEGSQHLVNGQTKGGANFTVEESYGPGWPKLLPKIHEGLHWRRVVYSE